MQVYTFTLLVRNKNLKISFLWHFFIAGMRRRIQLPSQAIRRRLRWQVGWRPRKSSLLEFIFFAGFLISLSGDLFLFPALQIPLRGPVGRFSFTDIDSSSFHPLLFLAFPNLARFSTLIKFLSSCKGVGNRKIIIWIKLFSFNFQDIHNETDILEKHCHKILSLTFSYF